MTEVLEILATLFGAAWAFVGFAAACAYGKPGLWRLTIWLGPLAFFLFPPQN